jgi:hypothetical protein
VFHALVESAMAPIGASMYATYPLYATMRTACLNLASSRTERIRKEYLKNGIQGIMQNQTIQPGCSIRYLSCAL